MLPDNIIGWLVVGLVAGVLGKIIMPGKDPGGVVVTILLGIMGALLAYYLLPMMGFNLNQNPSWIKTVLAATGGSIVLLAVYRLVMMKRT